MIDYGKLALGAFLLLVSFSSGWYIRNLDYQAFRLAVENTAKAQEAHVESITKQQALVTKGIENEYEAKITALRNYYANGLRHTDSNKLPSLPYSTKGANGEATDLPLACAYTTQQLVSLQDWIKAVSP